MPSMKNEESEKSKPIGVQEVNLLDLENDEEEAKTQPEARNVK